MPWILNLQIQHSKHSTFRCRTQEITLGGGGILELYPPSIITMSTSSPSTLPPPTEGQSPALISAPVGSFAANVNHKEQQKIVVSPVCSSLSVRKALTWLSGKSEDEDIKA